MFWEHSTTSQLSFVAPVLTGVKQLATIEFKLSTRGLKHFIYCFCIVFNWVYIRKNLLSVQIITLSVKHIVPSIFGTRTALHILKSISFLDFNIWDFFFHSLWLACFVCEHLPVINVTVLDHFVNKCVLRSYIWRERFPNLLSLHYNWCPP